QEHPDSGESCVGDVVSGADQVSEAAQEVIRRPGGVGFGIAPLRFPRRELQVAPCTASHFFLFGQEKVTKKKATPASGFCFANLPSLRRYSGGTSRRDVPVPSCLARRPASRPPAQRLRSAS